MNTQAKLGWGGLGSLLEKCQNPRSLVRLLFRVAQEGRAIACSWTKELGWLCTAKQGVRVCRVHSWMKDTVLAGLSGSVLCREAGFQP